MTLRNLRPRLRNLVKFLGSRPPHAFHLFIVGAENAISRVNYQAI
jgi:hypothetical protein